MATLAERLLACDQQYTLTIQADFSREQIDCAGTKFNSGKKRQAKRVL